jgi:hypothetical protein
MQITNSVHFFLIDLKSIKLKKYVTKLRFYIYLRHPDASFLGADVLNKPYSKIILSAFSWQR